MHTDKQYTVICTHSVQAFPGLLGFAPPLWVLVLSSQCRVHWAAVSRHLNFFCGSSSRGSWGISSDSAYSSVSDKNSSPDKAYSSSLSKSLQYPMWREVSRILSGKRLGISFKCSCSLSDKPSPPLWEALANSTPTSAVTNLLCTQWRVSAKMVTMKKPCTSHSGDSH